MRCAHFMLFHSLSISRIFYHDDDDLFHVPTCQFKLLFFLNALNQLSSPRLDGINMSFNKVLRDLISHARKCVNNERLDYRAVSYVNLFLTHAHMTKFSTFPLNFHFNASSKEIHQLVFRMSNFRILKTDTKIFLPFNVHLSWKIFLLRFNSGDLVEK